MDSKGYSFSFQALKPPAKDFTPEIPRFFSNSAARALEASLGQSQ
jgi:hypothetical protein